MPVTKKKAAPKTVRGAVLATRKATNAPKKTVFTSKQVHTNAFQDKVDRLNEILSTTVLKKKTIPTG